MQHFAKFKVIQHLGALHWPPLRRKMPTAMKVPWKAPVSDLCGRFCWSLMHLERYLRKLSRSYMKALALLRLKSIGAGTDQALSRVLTVTGIGGTSASIFNVEVLGSHTLFGRRFVEWSGVSGWLLGWSMFEWLVGLEPFLKRISLCLHIYFNFYLSRFARAGSNAQLNHVNTPLKYFVIVPRFITMLLGTFRKASAHLSNHS